MKNIVYFCNTYYQLIVLIRIKLTRDRNDNVTLIITNSCKDGELIADKIKQTGLFERVKFVNIPSVKIKENFKRALKGYDFCNLGNVFIDEILSFNFGIEEHWEFAYLYRINKRIECTRFEEGILSYATNFDKTRIIKTLYFCRRVLFKKNMRKNVTNFLCFCPKLYTGNLKPVLIKAVDFQIMKSILEQIFEIQDSIHGVKYLYLSSIYGKDGGAKIDEKELINKIGNYVGFDNLAIKIHPRDDASDYSNIPCSIIKSNSIPIEALFYLSPESNVTVISSFSGALLNISSLFGGSVKTVYTTGLLDCSLNEMASFYSKVLLKFQNLRMPNLSFVKDISEID